jgi:hypothetical protein
MHRKVNTVFYDDSLLFCEVIIVFGFPYLQSSKFFFLFSASDWGEAQVTQDSYSRYILTFYLKITMDSHKGAKIEQRGSMYPSIRTMYVKFIM